MTATVTPAIGAELLSQLGFLHVPGPPLAPAPAYLLVALRRRPTLEHFDPERVEYWASSRGRGVHASLDWTIRSLPAGAYSWGLIRVVDRLAVSNEYVAFGGQLDLETIADTKVAVFNSDAPILARGGHSQGWDPWADDLAAFFAKLRAAAGTDVGVERRLDELSPVARYAFFVAASVARYRASATLTAWKPQTVALLAREARRLSSEAPAEWEAGSELRDRLSAL
jgi:hypothetical protein